MFSLFLSGGSFGLIRRVICLKGPARGSGQVSANVRKPRGEPRGPKRLANPERAISLGPPGERVKHASMETRQSIRERFKGMPAIGRALVAVKRRRLHRSRGQRRELWIFR
jgi:hypothetical protein